MKIEEFCFICLKIDNLITFKVPDKRVYKEFTGYDILGSEKVHICAECKENLLNSVKFLRLCKKSNENFRNKTIKCQEVTIKEQSYDDNFILNDANPNEILKEQQSEHEILEVIEIENVTEDSLIEQDEYSNEIKKFKCETCDAQFKTSQKLKTHCLKHSCILKDWICEYDGCEKKFASEHRLKAHKRIHTNEKPYICDWENCNMKFAQSNALVCHKRIHLNQKPYVCKVCGKNFTQNTTLKTHVAAKHTGNQVQCDYPSCDKKFSRNSFLMLHKKRDHENIRNYNCEECGKQYKQKSHLDRHIEASHKKIRHQCQYCDKSFSKSWSLKIHQFKHTEASNFPYKCTECENSFQRRDIWLKHMNKLHPGIDVKRDAIEINVPFVIINKSHT